MKKASIALAVAATIGSMSAFAATSSISVGSITPSETKPANEIKVLKEDARRDMQIKANQERIADNFQQTI
ncbi:MAG: hypothetical protein JAY75_19195, partial [Candidatus Thiodiazotropha taylori]|nr:hypothetical protein [Candidatus Thiodiazotropha taylori]